MTPAEPVNGFTRPGDQAPGLMDGITKYVDLDWFNLMYYVRSIIIYVLCNINDMYMLIKRGANNLMYNYTYNVHVHIYERETLLQLCGSTDMYGVHSMYVVK